MRVIKNSKEKIKKIFKSRAFIFVTTALVFSTIGVSAATYFPSNDVTYDNKESGLKSTDVQGAIDELYGLCSTPSSAGNAVLDKVGVVTTGDGLYKDEYEDRYFFKGTNPNNYITFNGETAGWRIISVEYDGTIKIMKDASLGNIAWDEANTQSWTSPASLNTYLNSTYLNTLRTSAQRQIAIGNFSIGAATPYNNDLASQVNEENGTRWYGKIALPTVSEYIRANSNKNDCGMWSKVGNSNCTKTNWMYNANMVGWWTLTETLAKNNSYGAVHIIFGANPLDGNGNINSNRVTRAENVRPTLYLSSSVQITEGDGSQSNPFTIE